MSTINSNDNDKLVSASPDPQPRPPASLLNIISEMDLLSNLVPAVPPLLDPTNPLHNVTFLQNAFMSAFLGTFLANLGAQTVRMILGESVITI